MPLDIVICNIPGTLDYSPLSAPALLKASVEESGFSCKTLDFNIDLYQRFKSTPKKLDEIQFGFIENDRNSQRKEISNIVDELITEWANHILKLNPKFVGISVFTYQNQQCSLLISKKIKESNPNIKIVLGGQGLASGGINGFMSFPHNLKEKKIIDYYIRSEGEKSIIELLKGNDTFYGIDTNSFEQISDLNTIPIPDYDDYDIESYSIKRLPVTGSRGCIRRCTFCDIHDHWKYNYRDGEKIAEELITLKERYGISEFNFTDSLVNGNIKQFNKFISIVSKYNETHSKDKIFWSGQFIFRSPSRQVNDVYWENIKKSGGNLILGMESASEKVRNDMKKGFSDDDIHYTLENLEKFNIKCTILLLVGYPTEYLEDHQKTVDFFFKYRHLANNTIESVGIGTTLGILPDTPLYRQAVEKNIILDTNHENNWICLDNPELNLRERLRRRNQIIDTCKKLNFQTSSMSHDEENNYLIKHLKKNLERFEKRNVIQEKYFKNIKLKEEGN